LTSEDIEAIFDHLRDSQLIELYKKVTPYYPLSERHPQFLNEIPRDRLVRLVSRSLISSGNFRGPDNIRDRGMFLATMANPEKAQKIRQQIREYIDDITGPENFIVGAYSAFLHKIKNYALERKTVSLSHVIRSQTSLPEL
jgi:hypothetical protein